MITVSVNGNAMAGTDRPTVGRIHKSDDNVGIKRLISKGRG